MKRVEIKTATEKDVLFVAERLRKADREEVRAMGVTPREALLFSWQLSDYAWAGYLEGEPAMIFGCGKALNASVAEVWALGTDACTKAPREMLLYGRECVRMILDIYPELQNFCDARYTKAHRWLKKLGFQVSEPEPHGVKGEKFCKITISKGDI